MIFTKKTYEKPDQLWTSHFEFFGGRLAADVPQIQTVTSVEYIKTALWPQTFFRHQSLNHQSRDLAADIPKIENEAVIWPQTSAKLKIEVAIWPQTSLKLKNMVYIML